MGHRPLWRCPRCGRHFVARDMWHSCVRVPLGEHFRGKDPRTRRLRRAFRQAAEQHGRVKVVSSKTRIVCMHRVRLAGCQVRKRHLSCSLGLKRPPESPIWTRIEAITSRWCNHVFRFDSEALLAQPAMRRAIREAVAVGRQEA